MTCHQATACHNTLTTAYYNTMACYHTTMLRNATMSRYATFATIKRHAAVTQHATACQDARVPRCHGMPPVIHLSHSSSHRRQAWAHASLFQPSCQHSPSQTSNLHLSNLKLASFNPKTCITSSLSLPLKMSLASTPPHLLPGNWALYLADLISGVSCHTLCL